jgi:hypothetical protein
MSLVPEFASRFVFFLVEDVRISSRISYALSECQHDDARGDSRRYRRQMEDVVEWCFWNIRIVFARSARIGHPNLRGDYLQVLTTT